MNTLITARGPTGSRLAYKAIPTSFKIQKEKMLSPRLYTSLSKNAGKLPVGQQQKLLSRTVA